MFIDNQFWNGFPILARPVINIGSGTWRSSIKNNSVTNLGGSVVLQEVSEEFTRANHIKTQTDEQTTKNQFKTHYLLWNDF